MSKFLHSCLLATFLLLGACGGGSSSGGGESEGATESASDAGGTSDTGGTSGSGIAGTYVGPATATVSGGGLSETVTDTVQITISKDNTIAFGEPGQPPVATAVVNSDGDSFSISVPASYFNESGLECGGKLSVTGTVKGNAITGSISSSGVTCNGIPITITGSFNLEKVAAGSQSRASGGLMQSLRSPVSGMAQ